MAAFLNEFLLQRRPGSLDFDQLWIVILSRNTDLLRASQVGASFQTGLS
jgi:hypothetical protein